MDGSLRKQLRQVARRAVRRWGADKQLRQVQEECGELVAAVNRASRGREGSATNLAEEIADVTIMIEQARIIVGEHDVDAWIAHKLGTIAARLAKPEDAK